MLTNIMIALVAVIDHVHGHHINLSRRQENSTAASNPFASISPSANLTWSSCYEDSDARAFGPISCARLLVRTILEFSDGLLAKPSELPQAPLRLHQFIRWHSPTSHPQARWTWTESIC